MIAFGFAFACLVLIFTALHFCCAIVASRLMAELQSTPLGNELRVRAEDAQKRVAKTGFFHGGDELGFHPLSQGVWAGIFRRMDDLPAPQRRRAETLQRLRQLQLAVWACAAVLLVTFALHAGGYS